MLSALRENSILFNTGYIYIKHARPSRLDRSLDASCYAAVAEMGCRLPSLTIIIIILLYVPPPERNPPFARRPFARHPQALSV